MSWLVRGSRWSSYGLCRAGTLRSLGCTLVGTDIYERPDLLPLSDRHVDVIVSAYPPGTRPYATLGRAERARLREGLLDRYAEVLRAFDPRIVLPEP